MPFSEPSLELCNHSISINDLNNQIPHPRRQSIKLYKVPLLLEHNVPPVKTQGSEIFRYPVTG